MSRLDHRSGLVNKGDSADRRFVPRANLLAEARSASDAGRVTGATGLTGGTGPTSGIWLTRAVRTTRKKWATRWARTTRAPRRRRSPFRMWVAAALVGALLSLSNPGLVRAAEGAYVSVQDAWALAEAHHPQAVEAARRVTALERDLAQRRAAYEPTLDASLRGLSYGAGVDGRPRDPNPGLALNASLKLPAGMSITASVSTPRRGGSAEKWQGNVSFTYPLFRSPDMDADALALRQAEASLTAARYELERVLDEVRADVVAALHAEQTAAVRRQLAREALSDAKDVWLEATRRFELGIISELELLGAQVDLLRAEQEDIQAARTWQSRRDQLLRLLGLEDLGQQFENVFDWLALPEPTAPDTAIKKALQRSVTLWERMEAEEVAAMQLEDERARTRFDTRLSAGYSTVAQEGGVSDGWQVSLDVTYPLMDAGQRERTLASREEAYARAQEARREAEREVREQVEEAWAQVEDARRDVDIAELELTLARLELETVRRQAELPVATAGVDALRQARRALLRAETNWREAVQRYQARWIALEILQGPVDWAQLVGTSGEAVQ